MPQDRPITVQAFDMRSPLRITLLGTSLTALPDWPDRLESALAACFPQPPQVMRIAEPGRAVDWGLAHVKTVIASQPDIVLIEFNINDADVRDGHSLANSATMHRALIRALRNDLPDTRIALMTMSPAQGLRGWLRPRLAAHAEQYRMLAAEQDVGLVDLYPRWLARHRSTRGLQVDGLHPDPAVAAQVILPVLVPYLADAAGLLCES